MLSLLAAARFIHVVASIDHINAPCIWSEEDYMCYRWVNHQINTCRPYESEVLVQLHGDGKESTASSNGIKYILESLTPTDVATLRAIAQHQLSPPSAATTTSPPASPGTHRKHKPKKAPPPPQAAPVEYRVVYEECRRKLVVTTATAMRNAVKCLEEHGLVKKARLRNVEMLQIPFQEYIIKSEILERKVTPPTAAVAESKFSR